ncbi:MAG: hypothetical protein KF816_06465 [Melioribacteraceae bacterium]|nr:hypothetical protein [Melioribacteraceae bacterium]
MKNNTLYYVTNSENLKNILTVGIIPDINGYKKYYEDSLRLFPGYIPLVKDKIPINIINKKNGKDSSILIVLVEIVCLGLWGIGRTKNQTNINNEIFDSAECENGNISPQISQEIFSIDEKYDNYDYFLITPPISLSNIKSIIFPDNKSKNDFLSQSSVLSSINIGDIKIKTDKKLFSLDKNFLLEPFENINVSLDYTKIYSFGGGIASLFNFTCISATANEAFQKLAKQELDINFEEATNIDFLKLFFESTSSNIKHKIISILINSKDFKSDIINYLEEYGNSESSDKGKRAKEIADSLLNFIQKKEFTVSEYIKRSKSHLEKCLIVLFNKENLNDFLQTRPAYYELLSGEDIVIIAFLLGIKDKYFRIPSEIKSFNGLQNFISDVMVSYAKNDYSHLKQMRTLFDLLVCMENNELVKQKYNKLISGNYVKYKYVLPNPTEIQVDKSTYFITEEEIKYREVFFKDLEIQNSLKVLPFDLEKYVKIYNTLISE